MAVTINKEFDIQGAYVPNGFVLEGATSGYNYVLQIWNKDNTEKIADLRVQANNYNVGLVDVKNILQAHLGKAYANYWVPNTSNRYGEYRQEALGEYIHFAYKVRFGEVLPGQSVDDNNLSVDPTVYEATLSRNWRENEIQTAEAQVTLDTETNCTLVVKQGYPLSDIEPIQFQKMPGYRGMPTAFPFQSIASEYGLYGGKALIEDFIPGAWYSPLLDQFANVKGIEAVIMAAHNPDDTVDYRVIPNTIANQGGPNIAVGDGLAVQFPYDFTTLAATPGATSPVQFQAGARLYIYPVAYSAGNCQGDPTFTYARKPTHYPIVYDLVDQSECEYPYVSFIWLNSKGQYDKFTFTKRNEKRVNTKRQSFNKPLFDYDVNSYQAHAAANPAIPTRRGATVYSQQYETIFTAYSDFISDYHASFLESLFTSPEVYVQMNKAQWEMQNYNVQLDDEYREIRAVELISGNYVEKSFRKDGLFQYQVEFKVAQQQYTQRG